MRDRQGSRVFVTGSPSLDFEAAKLKLDRRRSISAFAESRPRSPGPSWNPLPCPDRPFGKDAPHITIGQTHRGSRLPPSTPGPGSYDPPIDPLQTSRLKHRFPTAFNYDGSPEPSIDYTDTHAFPALLPRYIGARLDRPFFDVIEAPGPTYFPPSTLSQHSHVITSRTRIPGGADSPSPCAYSPKYAGRPSPPVFSLSGPRERAAWLVAGRNPAPTDYAPDAARVRAQPPKWTIGSRSRLSRRRRAAVKGRSLAVGRILVTIDPALDIDECSRYIERHPRLRQLIDMLMDEILDRKPENPLEMMQTFFQELS
jgi:hypothetical protein